MNDSAIALDKFNIIDLTVFIYVAPNCIMHSDQLIGSGLEVE